MVRLGGYYASDQQPYLNVMVVLSKMFVDALPVYSGSVGQDDGIGYGRGVDDEGYGDFLDVRAHLAQDRYRLDHMVADLRVHDFGVDPFPDHAYLESANLAG